MGEECANCQHDAQDHMETKDGEGYCLGDGSNEDDGSPMCTCEEYEEPDDEDD